MWGKWGNLQSANQLNAYIPILAYECMGRTFKPMLHLYLSGMRFTCIRFQRMSPQNCPNPKNPHEFWDYNPKSYTDFWD